MQNVRTLAWLTVGAIIIAAFYASAIGDRGVTIDVEGEDGRMATYVREGDRGEFRFKDEDLAMEAHWRGDFTLSEDGGDVASLDGKLSIDIKEDGESQRAVFEPRRDGVRKRYYRDGKEESDNTTVNNGAGAVFVRFLRVSGIESQQRVSALIDNSDAGPALDEIAVLESDLAARRYILALNDNRDLSAAELTRLGEVLKRMDGDQELRLALSGLLQNETLTAESVTLLLETGQRMESDHDIRKLLESAAKAPLDDAALSQIVQLYARIEGDHDLRKAAEALLEKGDLNAAQKSLILTAAGQRIESDRDIRMLLEDSADDLAKAPELAPELVKAWLAGFDALEASRDQRLSIESAARNAKTPQLLEALIARTEAIDDSREQRQALEALAPHIADAPRLVSAYRDAAGMIDDARERERALNAVAAPDADAPN